jgi:hypothetical protein
MEGNSVDRGKKSAFCRSFFFGGGLRCLNGWMAVNKFIAVCVHAQAGYNSHCSILWFMICSFVFLCAIIHLSMSWPDSNDCASDASRCVLQRVVVQLQPETPVFLSALDLHTTLMYIPFDEAGTNANPAPFLQRLCRPDDHLTDLGLHPIVQCVVITTR